MATFNGVSFLNEQLASLAAQSCLPAELVIVDDNSSDGTRKLIDGFARSAPFPVTCINADKRLGYRVRFIEAATTCSGDIVAFCDQDDIWRPDKLALLTELFERDRPLLAFHNARLVDKTGVPFGETFPATAAGAFRPLETQPFLIIPGFSQALSRQLLKFAVLHADSVDPFNDKLVMAHDQFFLFWAGALGTIRFVPDPLADYRQHQTNEFGWHRTGLLADAVRDMHFTPAFLRSASTAATNRRDLLKRSLELGLCTAEQSHMAELAMIYYDALSRDLKLRKQLYRESTLAERVTAFVTMLRTGAYTNDSSRRFGMGPAFMDLLIGVPFGRSFAAFVSPERRKRADARIASRKNSDQSGG